jgi:hypothetical protein
MSLPEIKPENGPHQNFLRFLKTVAAAKPCQRFLNAASAQPSKLQCRFTDL